MKLVLANNQSEKFIAFHKNIQASENIYDYAGYQSLLFCFSTLEGPAKLNFVNVDQTKKATDYRGVYLNGYLNTPEIAAACAIVLDANRIPYVNQELKNTMSLSKLTMYAKLAAAGVTIPKSFGGTAYALLRGRIFVDLNFPAVLKRADADRGIDNYLVQSFDEIEGILKSQAKRSLWILQEFIPNDGFYLVSVYGGGPVFSIFRSLEKRPDKNQQKAHMFKPKGGTNAQLIELADLPKALLTASKRAAEALNRQIASVDSIFDSVNGVVYVLEVNYNPQLVTINTLKEVRQAAFLTALRQLGSQTSRETQE